MKNNVWINMICIIIFVIDLIISLILVHTPFELLIFWMCCGSFAVVCEIFSEDIEQIKKNKKYKKNIEYDDQVWVAYKRNVKDHAIEVIDSYCHTYEIGELGRDILISIIYILFERHRELSFENISDILKEQISYYSINDSDKTLADSRKELLEIINNTIQK